MMVNILIKLLLILHRRLYRPKSKALTTFPFSNVSVSLISTDAFGGRNWEVTFVANDNPVYLFSQNSATLTGSGARTVIASIQPGVPARHIVGSPFTVLVAPEETDPRVTIAYGKGLVHGEAGKMSTFTIQSKDTWGIIDGTTRLKMCTELMFTSPRVTWERR